MNPPTSVTEVQNAIQLKERRFMVQRQRILLLMLQSSTATESAENMDMSAKYSASLQQQHHQVKPMDSEATAQSNNLDPGFVENQKRKSIAYAGSAKRSKS